MASLSLLFVVVAQFLNAIVVLFDKHIVKSISRPIVYTFYGGMLSGVVVAMLPFGLVSAPSFRLIWLSLLAAVAFITSIYFLYDSLMYSAPSEVMPIVGAIAALSTFLFSFLILGDVLPDHFIIAFLFLIIGMVMISHFELSARSIIFLILSGILFGISSVLIKKIFIHEGFANGFFWSRMANVVAALSLMLLPSNFHAIKKDILHGPKKGKFTILHNKALSGFAFLGILVAIHLGNVSIVNALTSLQYVFLLIFAFVFTDKMKDYLSERRHPHEMRRKIFATLLIVVGFVILFT